MVNNTECRADALEGEVGHRKSGMFRDAHLVAEPVKEETDGRARVTPLLTWKWVVFCWGGPTIRQLAYGGHSSLAFSFRSVGSESGIWPDDKTF